MKIKGILFDFDGVIAHSEKMWFDTALLTLKKMSIPYDKQIKQKSSLGIISEHLFQKLILSKDYNLEQIIKNYKKELQVTFSQRSPKIYPHLKKFIRTTQLKIGIVSNAKSNYIIPILEKNNLLRYFKNNITSCTGSIRYKPFKDGYILGAKKLGLHPSEVMVIEDSDVGIEAALKAKVQKILRHTYNDENLPSQIQYHVPKLLSYKDLSRKLLSN
jgi:HAD superfamily hydrolase (TIGR01509 family)